MDGAPSGMRSPQASLRVKHGMFKHVGARILCALRLELPASLVVPKLHIHST